MPGTVDAMPWETCVCDNRRILCSTRGIGTCASRARWPTPTGWRFQTVRRRSPPAADRAPSTHNSRSVFPKAAAQPAALPRLQSRTARAPRARVPHHWITSSARCSSDRGIAMPSVFAVLRSMVNLKDRLDKAWIAVRLQGLFKNQSSKGCFAAHSIRREGHRE